MGAQEQQRVQVPIAHHDSPVQPTRPPMTAWRCGPQNLLSFSDAAGYSVLMPGGIRFT
jgi:hypothetical protein